MGKHVATMSFAPFVHEGYLNMLQNDKEERKWIITQFRNFESPYIHLISNLPGKHRITQFVSSNDHAVAAARSGAGIAILNRYVAADFPELVGVYNEIEQRYKLWILTHPDSRKSPRVTAFSSFVSKHFSNTGRI